ncbi:MAG: NUDIX hydrolase [Anaerolineales bacterium]|uniref:NUDIX hydrolase n=1 Tax=Candidatus Villigracilis proximus TaxID=3140683 RepID=UPI003136970A|nr:NUDIX hydrolase [Anaerolineales bacterium]
MPLKPWKILESNYVRPRYRFDKVELPNGKFLEATALEFRTWASVLALTKNQEVVLVRQFRHGAQDICWEFPGGVVEDGESPLVGVQRELSEETGYTTSNIIEVGKFYPNPALQTNLMHAYLAYDVEKTAIQEFDDAEDIEVHLVPLDELIAMTRRGEFLHGLQVAVLFHALAYLDRIK